MKRMRKFGSEDPDLWPRSSDAKTRSWKACFRPHQAMQHSGLTAVCDISDAYLQVPQRRFTVVMLSGKAYVLGYLLPGQRAASSLWGDFLAEKLKGEGFKPCAASPAVFAKPGKCCICTHVDDLLIIGSEAEVKTAIEFLRSIFKLKVQGPFNQIGDSYIYLKRHVCLHEKGIMVEADCKHVNSLIEQLDLQHVRGRSTPLPNNHTNEDTSELLDFKDKAVFQSATGRLMYLVGDRPDLMYAVRYLSSKMSSPTRTAWSTLIHVVCYVKKRPRVAILLPWTFCGRHPMDNQDIPHASSESNLDFLCIYSDSDWASMKGDRRSISGNCIYMNGVSITTASRTQRRLYELLYLNFLANPDGDYTRLGEIEFGSLIKKLQFKMQLKELGDALDTFEDSDSGRISRNAGMSVHRLTKNLKKSIAKKILFALFLDGAVAQAPDVRSGPDAICSYVSDSQISVNEPNTFAWKAAGLIFVCMMFLMLCIISACAFGRWLVHWRERKVRAICYPMVREAEMSAESLFDRVKIHVDARIDEIAENFAQRADAAVQASEDDAQSGYGHVNFFDMQEMADEGINGMTGEPLSPATSYDACGEERLEPDVPIEFPYNADEPNQSTSFP